MSDSEIQTNCQTENEQQKNIKQQDVLIERKSIIHNGNVSTTSIAVNRVSRK